jgi:hypothetical protein
LTLHKSLLQDARFAPLFAPQLDVVVWAVRARTATEASAAARNVFNAAAEQDLHLALATFPRQMAERAQPVEHWDQDEIVCLRACVMKPEHAQWIPQILSRLSAAATRQPDA